LSPCIAQNPDSAKKDKNKEHKAKQEQAVKPAPPQVSEVEAKPEPAKNADVKDRDKDKDDKQEHYDVSEIPPVVTHHQITVNGALLKYTATAGRLPLKRADGKIEAEMFFVAYTLDGQDPAKRPLTFAFNGGPGSSTIWLHMGALGPKRVLLQPGGFMPAAPYRVVDSAYTALHKTALVLVDAHA